MKFIFTVLTLLASLQAFADSTITQVISDKTTAIHVDLNTSTVKFSTAGYSEPTLKVLVPELAAITILDHRNVGENSPCMRVVEDNNQPPLTVPDILKNGSGTDVISVRVVETVKKMPYGNVCIVSLTEQVDTMIRGQHFTHSEGQELPQRNIADCK